MLQVKVVAGIREAEDLLGPLCRREVVEKVREIRKHGQSGALREGHPASVTRRWPNL